MPVPLIPICAISTTSPTPIVECIVPLCFPLPEILPFPILPPPGSSPPTTTRMVILNYPPTQPVPTGAILTNTTGSLPTGYLLCDGSEISRSTYIDLFNAIGTYYGEGNGSTTFNIPNLKNDSDSTILYIIKT
jgi:hypothetical protein